MVVTIHEVPNEDFIRKLCQTEHLLTFDDGLKSQEIALPILKEYGKKAIFFINNENKMEVHRKVRERMGVDFYIQFFRAIGEMPVAPSEFLSEYPFYTPTEKNYRYFRDFINPSLHDEIVDGMRIQSDVVEFLNPQKVVDFGFELGLHSATHPRRMDALKPHEQYDEWVENLALVRKYQREVLYASYPMGRYTEVTKEILSQLGIMDAFTSSELTSGYLETPRTDVWKLGL